ncbi:NAD(P)-binding protein [Hypoxylon sp. NC1633]|nr:NAD(P)-binding protein [Hypoxylon sp. NC1633]
MSDQKGTVLVTGANGGLGSAIASQLASNPEPGACHGIFTVRNIESANALHSALKSSTSTLTPSFTHDKVSLDLSRLSSVREVAAAINARVEAGSIPPIRALVLNAGYEEFAQQTWTQDGFDTSFAVNYLGHWLLAVLLLRSLDRDKGRIIWISSWAQNPEDRHNVMNGAFKNDKYKTMITDDLDPIAKGIWSPNIDGEPAWAAAYRRYGVSKLCGVSMIHELQRRLDQDPLLNNICVLAVDPSAMATGIIRHSSWFVRVLIFWLFAGVTATLWVRLFPNGTWRTPQKSAHDVLAAALDSSPAPLTERPKGLYLNGSEQGKYNYEAKDPEKGKVIWEGSVRFAQLKEGDTILRDWQ